MATVPVWFLLLTLLCVQVTDAHLTSYEEHIPLMSVAPTSAIQSPACPIWFIGGNGSECKCNNVPGVSCLSGMALLRIGYCMWHNPDTNELEAAECPFSYSLNASVYLHNSYILLHVSKSEVNALFCKSLHRTSTLCSHCLHGLGPPVLSYSLKCLRCLPNPYGWFLYVFVACFPSTVFFIVVIAFQIRATSPQLNFFIFASHYISFLAHFYPQANMTWIGKLLHSFYSIWSLEYFRYIIPPFCISEKHTLIHVQAAEYLLAFYPLSLIVLTYICINLHARGNKVVLCLWRPFRVCFTRLRRTWDPRGSIVHAFATFLLLSYSKLLHTSYFLWKGVRLYNNNGERIGHRHRIYLDASMTTYSSNHQPFLFLGTFVLCFFILLPLVFLCLYPFTPFQRCLQACRLRCHIVHAFAEAFNGCYKDGTNSSYDCRYFGGFYLLLRVSIFVSVFLSPWNYVWLVVSCQIVVVVLLLLVLRPYRDSIFNILDGFFFSLMLVCIMVDLYRNFVDGITPVFYYTIFSVPLVYFICFVSCKLIVQARLLHCPSRCCQVVRSYIERFAGYRHPNGEQMFDDHDIPHRLASPGEYQAYGFIPP